MSAEPSPEGVTFALLLGLIVAYRLVFLVLNLVLGAFFLIFLLSIPWLRSHGVDYPWFRYVVRESNIDYQHSWHGLIRAYWQSLHLPIPFRSLDLWSRIPTLSFPVYSNTGSSSDPELGKLVRLVDSTLVTPFVTTESDSTLVRSDSDTSKRSSLTTSTSMSRRLRLEPLRRLSFNNHPGTLSDVLSESYMTTDVATGPDYTTRFFDEKERHLSPSSQGTSPHDASERISVDLSDMRVMGSPVSPTTGGGSPIAAEDQITVPDTSSGRYRPATYGTVFSQHSIITLPAYREQEDDRVSVASRAPTYRSHRSTALPRVPLRTARPPLPSVPPPAMALPAPPSSYYLMKL